MACVMQHIKQSQANEDVTMKYLKDNHLLDRIVVTAAWVFWFVTFSIGFMLAKVTF